MTLDEYNKITENGNINYKSIQTVVHSMTFENYKALVLEDLKKKYINFRESIDGTEEYLQSEHVQKDIEERYKDGKDVGDCAWFLDLCF